MEVIDLSKPVEIHKDIYWVGSSEESLLRRNIYLRIFKGKGKQFIMLIDPGPPVDLKMLSKKVEEIIGGLGKVQLLFINHQDPDVVCNALSIQRLNPQVRTLMTEDTWRLVQFYGLKPNNFIAVEKFPNMRATMKTGQAVQFVPTPFCHFRGACMYYDVNSRILFSGDFLGGISTSNLYADESNWDGVKAFHQLYMPSRSALRYSVHQIRKLSPSPLMIAPQHGAILKGELIELFLKRMEELPVGMDLLHTIEGQQEFILEAVNEIAETAEKHLGRPVMENIFGLFHPDGSYPSLFTLGINNVIRDIKGAPLESVDALVQVIFSMCSSDICDQLKKEFRESLQKRALPMLQSLESDESISPDDF